MSVSVSSGVPSEAVGAARWLAGQALRVRRLDLAHRLLAGCVELDPSDGWSAEALARVALARGDAEAGREAAAHLLRLAPGSAAGALLYARAQLALDAPEEARPWLARAAGAGRGATKRTAEALLARLA